MLLDQHRKRPEPGQRSLCGCCGTEIVAKCGHIMTWHWAHLAADCDSWSEPESDWHIWWKNLFDDMGADIEVARGPHRADVVLPDKRVVELQAGFLSADDIEARETFYGPGMIWLYRCHWKDRLHFGKRGFWWKHSAKSLAFHRRPLWWDTMDGFIHQVTLGVRDESPHRVLGKVLRTVAIENWPL